MKRQEAILHIIGNMDKWKTFQENFRDDAVPETDKYLQSNLIAGSRQGTIGSRIKSVVLNVRDPGAHFTISNGIRNTTDVIDRFVRFYKTVFTGNLPEILSGILTGVRDMIEYRSALEVNRKKNADIIAQDRLLRNDWKPSLERLLTAIYQLDAYISMASAAVELGLNFPEFLKAGKPRLSVQEMFHPFLKKPVKNNFKLIDGHFVFLTGPNMAGKTTFLKTMGVCVYLAHTGMPVPAKTMELTFCDGLISSINTEDNIHLGYSYFYSEVKRVKEIAEFINRNKRAVVIMDEMFKGTNVKDAFDATGKIAGKMVKYTNSVFFLSSHITELEIPLKKLKSVGFHCFEAKQTGQTVTYDYKLKPGVSKQRLGLLIMEKENVFKILDGK